MISYVTKSPKAPPISPALAAFYRDAMYWASVHRSQAQTEEVDKKTALAARTR